ncbi:hypothetical protein F5Y13DRAFT_171810 [Hypoxylon sp. FL1857]|nr:hypothetical protein F5Y13DRAFT_171810 [Hypoxylon sp. FL1857]
MTGILALLGWLTIGLEKTKAHQNDFKGGNGGATIRVRVCLQEWVRMIGSHFVFLAKLFTINHSVVEPKLDALSLDQILLATRKDKRSRRVLSAVVDTPKEILFWDS